MKRIAFVLLAAVLICSCSLTGCGKKKHGSKTEEPPAEVTAAEENQGAESSAGPGAEAPDEAGDPPKEESTPLDSPAEQPAGNEQAEAAEEAAEFVPHDFSPVITVLNRDLPWGFRENRVWVHNASGDFLIDPDGSILYAVPTAGSGETNVRFTEFAPVLGGLTYISGKEDSGSYSPVSVALDSDGHEICRFEADGNTTYTVIGASESHFLILAVTASVRGEVHFLISMNSDGSTVGEPHPFPAEDDFGYPQTAKYLGDDLFAIGNSRDRLIAFYNAANNTLQRCDPFEHFSMLDRFCGGRLFVPAYSEGGYIVAEEDLQEEKRHFVLTNMSRLEESAQQAGPFLFTGNNLYDLDGRGIKLPREFEYPVITPDPEGYALIAGENAFTVIGPDGSPLYDPQPRDDMEVIMHSGSGGFLEALNYSGEDYHGIIDRSGAFHPYSGDLSGISGLSDAHFMGFGCGYVIDYADDLGIDDVEYMAIKSLETGDVVSGIKETPDTSVYGEAGSPVFHADFPEAGDNSASSGTDVSSMGTDGIIAADSFENVLIFDRDGVTVTMENFNLFLVENNNEDNLQASVYMANLYFDNLASDEISSDFTGMLRSGESKELTIVAPESEWDFWRWASRHSAALSDLPLVEVTCEFYVTIGKDGDEQLYRRTILLNGCSEDDLSALYDCYVGEAESSSGVTLEAYLLRSGDEIAYAFRNTSEELMETDNLINGNGYIAVNGEKYTIVTLDIPGGMTGLVRVDTADNIRKNREIRNSDSFTLEAVFPDGIVIDLGEAD